MKKKLVLLLSMLMVLAFIPIASADQHTAAAETATISITFRTSDSTFGETGMWEASLYAGAVAGEETSGRFTDWKVSDEEGVVEFVIPEETREDHETPWNVEMDTYIRVRSVDDDAYPQFDMVSAPFTLEDGMSYSVTISLVSVVLEMEDIPDPELPVVPEEPTDPAEAIEVMMWINQTEYTINGEPGTADVAPFIQNGRTMVPISFVARAMNLYSDWGPRDSAAEWVRFEGNNMRIELEIGSTEITIWEDGVERTEISDVAAQIVDGRTVLPLRAVGEILGADFDWAPKDAATEWVSFTCTPTAVIEEPLPEQTKGRFSVSRFQIL